jgi:lipid-binding SYLF domain-containing protein
MNISRRGAALGLTTASLLTLASGKPARAASAAELIRDGNAALANLYSEQPHTKLLEEKAKAVLIFPNIVKAGLIIGAQTGNGVLFEGGEPVNYYNISAASYGLQAGVQSFSYALFFMTEKGLSYLAKSYGWSVGVGPSVVVLDKSAARSFTSTSLTQDVYAVPFGAEGLMAGIGIEGSKITAISPDP